jgi:hypothetical protein
MNNETVHTYRVTWAYDCEATNPVSAALEYLYRIREATIEDPIVGVKQFVDTDKTPRCYDVDLHDLTAVPVDPATIRMWVLVEVDNIGSVENLNVYTNEEEANKAYKSAMIEWLDGNTDVDAEYLESFPVFNVAHAYLRERAEAENPGSISFSMHYISEVGHGL